jgi:hypothetical protein
MGRRLEFLELTVDRKSGETIKAIAAELGVPVQHVVSIALEWFADVMCTPDGSVCFTEWLQDRSVRAGWNDARQAK